jgi:hypothetical protein
MVTSKKVPKEQRKARKPVLAEQFIGLFPALATLWLESSRAMLAQLSEFLQVRKEGRRKSEKEGGRRKEEGGRRKEEGGRRKEEGGRRKEEGGRRKVGIRF